MHINAVQPKRGSSHTHGYKPYGSKSQYVALLSLCVVLHTCFVAIRLVVRRQRITCRWKTLSTFHIEEVALQRCGCVHVFESGSSVCIRFMSHVFAWMHIISSFSFRRICVFWYGPQFRCTLKYFPIWLYLCWPSICHARLLRLCCCTHNHACEDFVVAPPIMWQLFAP